MKDLEIKRKHHYVWAHYLKSWCAEKNNTYYISKKNNICNDSVLGLSCEKDFYKVDFLDKYDIYIAKNIISKCDSTLKKLHNNFLNIILNMQSTFYSSDVSIYSRESKEAFQHNFYENYLSSIENGAVDILEQLRNGNLSMFEDKSRYYSFCYFLGCQLSRTKRLKDISLNVNTQLVGPNETIARLREFTNRHWWFMCNFYF